MAAQANCMLGCFRKSLELREVEGREFCHFQLAFVVPHLSSCAQCCPPKVKREIKKLEKVQLLRWLVGQSDSSKKCAIRVRGHSQVTRETLSIWKKPSSRENG